MKLSEIKTQSEKFYYIVNQFVSEGTIPLVDMAYPGHDGVQDADAVSELMLLRDRLNAIAEGCKMAIDNINVAIEMNN